MMTIINIQSLSLLINVQQYLIIISHMHATVKHDILSPNCDQDTASTNILKVRKVPYT